MMTTYLLYLSIIFSFEFLELKNGVQGDGGCRGLNFLPCQDNAALVGHVITTVDVLPPAIDNCQHRCFLEDKCVSYNLGPRDGSWKTTCNLSDTDHVEYPKDVKPVTGAQYCPIENECAKNPCPSYTICKPDFDYDSFKCLNKTSCADLKSNGKNENGVYNITPIPGNTIEVYCDQVTDGGGWTVIQKRLDGSVDFYRGWDEYKRGFGNKNGEYWLGLDAIHNLTNLEQNEIRIDLEDFDGNKLFVIYDSFKVGPESENYKLYLGSYEKGTVGNSFGIHNMCSFSTYDRDNDDIRIPSFSCAQFYKGAWWFKSCLKSHLNGEYSATPVVSSEQGINWSSYHTRKSLKKAEMKIRPVSFQY